VKAFNYVSLGVAVVAGVATLVLLFVPDETLGNIHGLTILLGWITTLASVALLIGILNLLSVHFRKASLLKLNSIYSGVFLLSFIAVMFMWVLSVVAKALFPPDVPNSARDTLILYGDGTVNFAFKYIQTPVESSLSAVLAVVMVLAGTRLIRTRRHWSAVLFILVALFLIISMAPIAGLPLEGFRAAFTQFIAVGAARGILLGVSLGVIATGLRVIVGVDQPYGE
jgi:hypothetical protein